MPATVAPAVARTGLAAPSRPGRPSARAPYEEPGAAVPVTVVPLLPVPPEPPESVGESVGVSLPVSVGVAVGL